ncbi:hypothetical protein [Pararhizobium mangrovi]|uniref:hypothetical protein n=1 Tax=Pararhizobium mangrovi TaxID=2590452 RepID=UPI001F2818E4|nr:hypothetical protein [Pararhizobium mangrovi]
MSAALARHLQDFSAPVRPVARASAAGDPAPTPAPVDIEAERTAAYEEGYRAAEAALAGEHEAALATLRNEHSEALAAAHADHAEAAGAALAAGLERMRGEVSRAIGAEAARIVAPFVDEAIAGRLAETFAETIREALAGDGAPTVSISGPAWFFARVAALPALAEIALAHVESETHDLHAEIDGSVLATRLEPLRAALAEVTP